MSSSEDPVASGPTHVVFPTITHSHTAIILHGRGDTGAEHAEEFLSSPLSSGKTLQDLLPGWRWVFPSAPKRWSTAFQEDMPAWFEAHSLADPSARQDLQTPGIQASLHNISKVIAEEVNRLGGVSSKVVLGGISQGGAVALLTLLSGRAKGIGGFFAASTWLPFASDVEYALFHEELPLDTDMTPRAAMLWMFAGTDGHGAVDRRATFLLGHGADDAYVDVELGREAARILRRVGYEVVWKEYTGAEQEGHWFKVPEGIDDVFDVLEAVSHN